jgi:hypothetical protein
MKNLFVLKATSIAILLSLSAGAFAEEEEQLQDMSDPLAVFTQAGVGVTNKGLNLKIGESYDTGSDTTMGMNIIEIKGFGGEALGWDSNSVRDNSIDSMRYRNFTVDMTNGRGKQIDINYDIESDSGSASYSFIQALPKMGPVQFFPLVGLGSAFGNDLVEDDGSVDSGYSIAGTFTVVGLYSKIVITDKIWLNYNPMFLSSLSGSDNYTEHGFEGDDSVLLHEFAASYQLNPRSNLRYFANWTENTDFSDGEHRLEYNYQF